MTDSDSESQSETEPLIENKAFPQQRFSPVSGVKAGEVTCLPKPIKARYANDLETSWKVYPESNLYPLLFFRPAFSSVIGCLRKSLKSQRLIKGHRSYVFYYVAKLFMLNKVTTYFCT